MAHKHSRFNLQMVQQFNQSIRLRFEATVCICIALGVTTTGPIDSDDAILLSQGFRNTVSEILQIARKSMYQNNGWAMTFIDVVKRPLTQLGKLPSRR